ncbi:MAG: NUDIX domain-containing protein [Candidatus Obscuribacterales bacterium]|nr:NUDIX domain-containing protein [Candidatus Obscuribacterales bacterium]
MKHTSGTLLYKYVRDELHVLLVHASGNYNKKSPWGIPKGQPDPGEELEEAARRETLEETGIVCGDLSPLGYVDYKKSKKRIFCFVGPAPKRKRPVCASWEIDGADFFSMEEARDVIHPDQEVFLDRLEDWLDE